MIFLDSTSKEALWDPFFQLGTRFLRLQLRTKYSKFEPQIRLGRPHSSFESILRLSSTERSYFQSLDLSSGAIELQLFEGIKSFA